MSKLATVRVNRFFFKSGNVKDQWGRNVLVKVVRNKEAPFHDKVYAGTSGGAV